MGGMVQRRVLNNTGRAARLHNGEGWVARDDYGPPRHSARAFAPWADEATPSPLAHVPDRQPVHADAPTRSQCWGGHEFVTVPLRSVWQGKTVSCGREGCEPGAALEPERGRGRPRKDSQSTLAIDPLTAPWAKRSLA